MANETTTDELGAYIAAALESADGVINAHIPDAGRHLRLPGCQPEPDCDLVWGVDAADRSNIRITTERGAVFVLRIIREG